MKKIGAIILTLCLLWSCPVFAGSLTNMTVGNASGKIGDIVEIAVSLENMKEIAGAQFTVEYNTNKLQLVKVNDTGVLSEPVLNDNFNSYPYVLSWGNGIVKCNNASSGKIVGLEFKILDTFTKGTENVTIKVDEVYDMDLNEVPFTKTSVSGQITLICSHTFGNWITEKEATYSADGLEKRICDKCKCIETRVISKKANPFVDVASGTFYYNPVLWALDNKITSGVDETHFGPDKVCTRGQVVTFLWRAAGSPEPTTTKNPFVDVSSADYYYKPVLWAVENKITSGVNSTHFGPNDSCTRGQVVTFLCRSQGNPVITITKNPFVDVSNTDYYYNPVLWAVENGITAGVNETHFGPNQSCTRGQVVTFLYRTFN